MHWTIKKPTQPGTYMIRPLPCEKLVLGSHEFTQAQEVELAFVPGDNHHGLCIFLGFSAIEVKGAQMEYYGPLQRLACFSRQAEKVGDSREPRSH